MEPELEPEEGEVGSAVGGGRAEKEDCLRLPREEEEELEALLLEEERAMVGLKAKRGEERGRGGGGKEKGREGKER